MADQPDSEWRDPGRAERLGRREERRRALRRRRIVAAGGLVGVVAAVVAIVLAARGGSSGSSPPAAPRQAAAFKPAGAKAPASPVRNATPQPDWAPDTGPVPILEYHVLAPLPKTPPTRSST